MRIGELSKATGASTRALRYYEQQGLLSSNRRSNGYREFTASAVNEAMSTPRRLMKLPAT